MTSKRPTWFFPLIALAALVSIGSLAVACGVVYAHFRALPPHPARGIDLESRLDFTLPPAGDFKAKEPLAPEAEQEIRSDVMVHVATDARGAIGKIVVQSPGAETIVADMPALKKHLAALRPKLDNKDSIKISAESRLKYNHLIEVMDTCIQAGFAEVGFAPPPDLAP